MAKEVVLIGVGNLRIMMMSNSEIKSKEGKNEKN